MSRTFTLIGNQSVLNARYFPPVELDSSLQYGLGLIGFYTFNSVLNVDVSNNRFVYKHALTDEVHTIYIPEGNYEIDSLGKYIQQIMVLGQQKQYDDDDDVNRKEHNDDNDEEIFSLKADNTTLRCVMKCKHDIDFTGVNTPARMLGFIPSIYEHDQQHQSNLSVEILKHRIMRVECNIVSGAYSNNDAVHTLFEFDNDVEPGYKLTIEPRNIIYMPINRSDLIDNITLRVVDERGELIDFRGEEIIIRLELKTL